MGTNVKLLEQIKTSLGKPFEVVSGRNAYTFDKTKHLEMLQYDGIYLLLENQPQENLKNKYNRALVIAARVVNQFFPTNDPQRVKFSFHLGADKMRFEFHQQMYKMYESTPCIIKTIPFEDTRREYTLDRSDYEKLKKNEGELIFAYTVGKKQKILVQLETFPATAFTGFEGNSKKSMVIHLQLSAYALKLLDDLGYRKLLTKEKIPPPAATVQPAGQNVLPIGEETKPSWVGIVDTYLTKGTQIKIILPEGRNELVLDCMITKQERRSISGDKHE